MHGKSFMAGVGLTALLMAGATAGGGAIPAASFTAQMDRMERLTQDALARGNARIRAVRPASEQ
jgi:hypothetical protein